MTVDTKDRQRLHRCLSFGDG